MTVRCPFAPLLACVALLWAAGCNNDTAPLPSETSEPLYLQGLQLMKEGRNPEALVDFLKVIEKRGERASAESHFEAGLIYLDNIKDYVEAIHHFQKYRELQPNSPQARRVLDLINTGKREYMRSLAGRPTEDQSVRLESAEQLDALRRENAELRAVVSTLRGGGAIATRPARPSLLPDLSSPPARPKPLVDLPAAPAPASASEPSIMSPVTSSPKARPPSVAPTPAPAPAPAPSGRTHTVRAGEGLFAIAKQFAPKNTSLKMQEIADANRDLLPNGIRTTLKPGMVLKIP